jgi:hypothetical protein
MNFYFIRNFDNLVAQFLKTDCSLFDDEKEAKASPKPQLRCTTSEEMKGDRSHAQHRKSCKDSKSITMMVPILSSLDEY